MSRRPTFQFSLRALLIAVTLVAIGTAAYLRQTHLSRRLAYHRQWVQQCADLRARWYSVSFHVPQSAWRDNDAREAYHAALAEQFERAWWRPWTTVEVPPEPQPEAETQPWIGD